MPKRKVPDEHDDDDGDVENGDDCEEEQEENEEEEKHKEEDEENEGEDEEERGRRRRRRRRRRAVRNNWRRTLNNDWGPGDLIGLPWGLLAPRGAVLEPVGGFWGCFWDPLGPC